MAVFRTLCTTTNCAGLTLPCPSRLGQIQMPGTVTRNEINNWPQADPTCAGRRLCVPSTHMNIIKSSIRYFLGRCSCTNMITLLWFRYSAPHMDSYTIWGLQVQRVGFGDVAWRLRAQGRLSDVHALGQRLYEATAPRITCYSRHYEMMPADAMSALLTSPLQPRIMDKVG